MISKIWHPMTQHGFMPPEIHVDSAEGAYLYSGERVILDAISSWWVITHGHCHPRIVAAVQEQAAKLDQVIFSGFTHSPAEALAEALLDLTDPAHAHVFFSDSGSTAVEVALKMAVGYHAHKGKPRTKFLALEGGYHGDTFGAMAAGGRGIFNDMFADMMFHVEHIPINIINCEHEGGLLLQDCDVVGGRGMFSEQSSELRCLAYLRDVLEREGDQIAGFIFEPLVQGSAGMRMYSPALLRAMCDLCHEYGVLLIADEVMTGFGRLGTMFACEQVGVTADLVALSKGLTGGFLPMGATLATRDIYMAFYHDSRAKTFFHSTSFTGNALACVAAKASLDIWMDGAVQAQVDMISDSHVRAVERFAAHEKVEHVRSLGTILALDVKDNGIQGYLSDLAPRLMGEFLRRDVLLRPIGNVIYILPPYCVSQQDLDVIYDAIDDVLGVV